MTLSDTLAVTTLVARKPYILPVIFSIYKPYGNRTNATLTRPGATLAYTIHGNPLRDLPILLTISGANGERGLWQPFASYLHDDFTVITYDRRSFSESTCTESPRPDLNDAASRVSLDADDAAAIIREVKGERTLPVYVVGNSIGAVITLELLVRHPDLLTKAIAHEPPHSYALPTKEEREACAKRWTDLRDLYRRVGIAKAVTSFSPQLGSGLEADALAAGMMSPLAENNVRYWFEWELTQYTTQEMKFEEWKTKGANGKLVLAVGKESVQDGKVLVDVARALSKETGASVVEMPGHHIGCLIVAKEYAEAVRQIIKT